MTFFWRADSDSAFEYCSAHSDYIIMIRFGRGNISKSLKRKIVSEIISQRLTEYVVIK